MHPHCGVYVQLLQLDSRRVDCGNLLDHCTTDDSAGLGERFGGRGNVADASDDVEARGRSETLKDAPTSLASRASHRAVRRIIVTVVVAMAAILVAQSF